MVINWLSRNDKGLGAQRAACRTEGVDSYCPQRGRHPTTAGTRLAFRGRRHRSEGALGALPCLRGGGTKLGPVSQSLADLQRTHTHSFSRAAGRLSQGQGQALERGPKARSEHCLWFALQPRDNDFASLSTAPSIRKPLKAPRPHGAHVPVGFPVHNSVNRRGSKGVVYSPELARKGGIE